MKRPIVHVTDHAVLRYLERAHGLDVAIVKQHLAGLAANGARLGAFGVTIENVKLLLAHHLDETHIITALEPQWPAIPPKSDRA